jgi:hypothetical protein
MRWHALWLGAAVFAADAQTGAPSPSAAQPRPALTNPPAAGQQSQQQGGFIAPVVDIRIQGEGIALPQPKSDAEPAPAKPPAK